MDMSKNRAGAQILNLQSRGLGCLGGMFLFFAQTYKVKFIHNTKMTIYAATKNLDSELREGFLMVS